ncbi:MULTISPECIES: LacI family DNA-binding transcriptional regulator [Clostridium]|jgi:LacI family transcriptional regulator|uniref:LacI family DNA-binding transcriptional regulator n=1 Tax=Clostridium TaxID=1485 RepID=UPI00115954B5|nr:MULTISPECIES: LacI family DNA-binding transcriptional regulator [Clostridium]MDB1969795.1 LacI family DNA-binding transcriptional regulator [Clostridium tertium]MDU1566989.1 LacI family DNA-binding transcriptional regulator [Clostridium sp.]MDU2155218.1 LacI family DNA-binding transcriptional regulator [Clostridium sp.]MDU2459250.1 LacI family DNA-binding transcriptional regulator [Clostridium sp.]MDU3407730.1 LacI family DNA-binding transcriptional regulator [Clostridium sp.]
MGKITMKDIAERLDISINAVSLALNSKAGVSEETRKQVLDVAEELGYLDKSPKFVKSFANKNICVIIKKYYFEDNTFYSKIMMGIGEESRRKGYDIITCLINETEENIPSCIESKKVCGIIVIGTIEDEYLVKLKNYKIPVVLVDHTSLLESTDSILTDNKLGSFNITKLLIEKGYKDIGFFGDLEYSLSIKERFFGYREAIKKFLKFNNFKEAEVFIEEQSVLYDVEQNIIDKNIEGIKERINRINKIPEAFVCSNDNAAIALITSLKELGYMVPKDIAVVGFDDIVLSSLIEPKLTTVRVEKDFMGRKAVDRLLWRIENKKDPDEKTILSVEVIERDSVGNKNI